MLETLERLIQILLRDHTNQAALDVAIAVTRIAGEEPTYTLEREGLTVCKDPILSLKRRRPTRNFRILVTLLTPVTLCWAFAEEEVVGWPRRLRAGSEQAGSQATGVEDGLVHHRRSSPRVGSRGLRRIRQRREFRER